MIGGIYRIRNRRDGTVYVGQAVDFERRRKQHFKALRGGYHRNAHLQRAFDRDGESAFAFEAVEHCPANSLTAAEQFWLDFYASMRRYNICPAAESRRGVPFSDEHRAKLSAAKKGKVPPFLTKEAREKAVASRKARWAVKPKSAGPAESHKKRAETLKAKWAVTPKKPPSDEGRARMAEAARKRWASASPEERKARGALLRRSQKVNG